MCLKIFDCREDVEEIVNDTFLIAYRKIKQLKGDTLIAYLRRIAINLCYARRKKASREHELFTDDGLENYAETNEDFLPEEYVENKEKHLLLLQIVSELPPRQREIIYLYFFADISTVEIAKMLGCPPGNVRKTLHVAKNALKAKLEVRNRMSKMALVPFGMALQLEGQNFAATHSPSAFVTPAVKSITAYVVTICLIVACIATVAVYIAMQYTVEAEEVPNLQYVITELTTQPVIELPTPPPTEPELDNPTDYSYEVDEAEEPTFEYEAYSEPEEPVQQPTSEVIETLPPPTTQITTPHTEMETEPEPDDPTITTYYESYDNYEATPPQEEEEEEDYDIQEEDYVDILALLYQAASPQEVLDIAHYHSFTVFSTVRSSVYGWYRFYVLEYNNGHILLGVHICEYDTPLRTRFAHYQYGQMPTGVFKLFMWMRE